MRLKLQFETTGKKQILPLNYQYPVSAWIYKVFDNADSSFAEMLHDEGYTLENGKTFKLFTFSKLRFPKHTWKIIPGTDRMEVWARKAWLTISFQLPEQLEKFVTGLFQDQEVFIGDKNSGIEMRVTNIENLGQEIFKNQDAQNNDNPTVKFKTVTPIVIGYYEEGNKNKQYINPVHPEYKRLFITNLIDKYKSTGAAGNTGEKDIRVEFTKLNPKTELQTIKAYTPGETKVRAYHYEFELTAPPEILETGYNAGFGSMNSLGFGFCEVVKEGK